ncbi:MAG: hypothetical protein OK422_02870 [Thaumarchaeota archaeon]|nr:hypothetical protein [Nitrososphaerota archaeon]
MDYFAAVQEGRSKVQRAVQFLEGVAGPSSPLLFIKMGKPDWTPVGEENLYSILPGKDSTASIVLCDRDGNTKAMSGWLPRENAQSVATLLEGKGIVKYAGEVKLPI